jgi:hypothetical protein
MKKTYTFEGSVTITMTTTVEASSLPDAIKKAKSRGVMSLCYSCGDQADDELWCTTGELDGDPASSPLSGVSVDGVPLEGAALESAMVRW